MYVRINNGLAEHQLVTAAAAALKRRGMYYWPLARFNGTFIYTKRLQLAVRISV